MLDPQEPRGTHCLPCVLPCPLTLRPARSPHPVPSPCVPPRPLTLPPHPAPSPVPSPCVPSRPAPSPHPCVQPHPLTPRPTPSPHPCVPPYLLTCLLQLSVPHWQCGAARCCSPAWPACPSASPSAPAGHSSCGGRHGIRSHLALWAECGHGQG